MPIASGRVVYSTDPEVTRRCPRCGQYPCVCRPEKPSLAPGKQVARISRDRKNRKGKTVTLIAGLQLNAGDLEALAKQLKAYCGAGGTVKDGEIEIQGDHRERIAARLEQLGYKVKLVGG